MIYSTAENFLQPVVQYDGKSDLYRLMEDYILEWGRPHLRRRFNIKAGYEWDFASTPKPLRGIARSNGPWIAPSLVHDRGYGFKGLFPEGEYQTLVNGEWKNDTAPWRRSQLDEFLEQSGIWAGASKFDAWLYKTAVQLWPINWFKGF